MLAMYINKYNAHIFYQTFVYSEEMLLCGYSNMKPDAFEVTNPTELTSRSLPQTRLGRLITHRSQSFKATNGTFPKHI